LERELALRPDEVRVCILRAPGTNCDRETARCFRDLGVQVSVLRANELKGDAIELFDLLVIPGGFSYGDYVRAGALWAKRLFARFRDAILDHVESGRLLLGICNGFQVLVEAGLLPWTARDGRPTASLAVNASGRFECRWVVVRNENRGRCAFTSKIPQGALLKLPVAHSEGRFLLAEREAESNLRRLLENDQLVFRYADVEGSPARGVYPYNPNGSYEDIAGVCNEAGNVLGLMPHPERAFYPWQYASLLGEVRSLPGGSGRLLLESAVEYICSEL
jgi:phosphoribosylformylglycinamidine synthase